MPTTQHINPNWLMSGKMKSVASILNSVNKATPTYIEPLIIITSFDAAGS